MADDRMLSDEILLGLIKANSGGGGGGTSNYNDLSNKPQIGGVTLSGNKSASDLGLVAAVDGKGLSTNDYTDADKAIVGGVTAALAGKQGKLTAGSHIKIDDDEISVQRWAVPAGDVIYKVITGAHDPSYNPDVERYTADGQFIDSRRVPVDMWGSYTLDDMIRFDCGYVNFTATLLVASHEQAAGQWFTLADARTQSEHSCTFTLPQEENDNDLIIRSELDAVSSAVSAIKDGQSIDSFADVETALATKADLTDLAPAFSTATAYAVGQYVSYDGNIYKCTSAHSAGAWVAGDFTLVAVGSELESKQDKTDNSLQTTDKTVVGAINEHEGDIGSLMSGLTDVNSNIAHLANLKFLPVNFTDTFEANATLTNGVTVSDLTGGVLTDDSRIKGIVMYNVYPFYMFQLQYQGKIMLGTDVARSSQETITNRMVIMYI